MLFNYYNIHQKRGEKKIKTGARSNRDPQILNLSLKWLSRVDYYQISYNEK